MGKMKEKFMEEMAKKAEDDIFLSTIFDIEDKLDAIRPMIDADDYIGNLILNYVKANIEDVASFVPEVKNNGNKS